MKLFNEETPIYLQLRKHIEELILDQVLKEEDSIPSLRMMAKDYSLNPITISNALSALVDEGILYKKRGLGVYVAGDARRRIIDARREDFLRDQLEPCIERAKQLEITAKEITNRISDIYGGPSD